MALIIMQLYVIARDSVLWLPNKYTPSHGYLITILHLKPDQDVPLTSEYRWDVEVLLD